MQATVSKRLSTVTPTSYTFLSMCMQAGNIIPEGTKAIGIIAALALVWDGEYLRKPVDKDLVLTPTETSTFLGRNREWVMVITCLLFSKL